MRGDLQREGETLSAERASAGLAPHPGAGPSANVGGERDYGSCCNGSSAHPRIAMAPAPTPEFQWLRRPPPNFVHPSTALPWARRALSGAGGAGRAGRNLTKGVWRSVAQRKEFVDLIKRQVGARWDPAILEQDGRIPMLWNPDEPVFVNVTERRRVPMALRYDVVHPNETDKNFLLREAAKLGEAEEVAAVLSLSLSHTHTHTHTHAHTHTNTHTHTYTHTQIQTHINPAPLCALHAASRGLAAAALRPVSAPQIRRQAAGGADVNHTDPLFSCWTPLHYAAWNGHAAAARALLELGAYPFPLDRASMTPWQCARLAGRDAAEEELRRGGAAFPEERTPVPLPPSYPDGSLS
jgi:hypothetical protein